MLDVRVLGPLEVRRQEQPVVLGARLERALLAVLVLEAGRVVPADRIVDLLWGAAPPPKAVPALHTKVAHLRRALEPDRAPRAGESVLETVPPGYRLSRAALAVDADRFEELAARAAATDEPAVAAALAEQALGLWHGPALGEFSGEPFARAAVDRWEGLRLSTLETHAEALLALGNVPRAVAALQPHVTDHPLREQARALLARALYLSGQQAAALESLAQGRRLLREELGLDPGPELQELERRILDHDSLLRPRGLPVRAVSGGPPLHGRDAERALLRARLADAADGAGSVVLLTGDGGIGKSALLEDLRAAAERGGSTARWATCSGGLAAPPFWPVLQVVREAAAETDAAGRSRLGGRLGPLRDLVPDLVGDTAGDAAAPAGGVDPAMVVVHLTVALEQALAPGHDPGRAGLLVLDDMHLADPATLGLVTALAGRVHRSRTLLALSLRPGEADSPALVDVLAGLARLPRFLRLDLDPLSPRVIAELVRTLGEGDGHRLTADVVDDVVRRAEGNPFFAVELARVAATECAEGTAAAPERGRPVGRVPVPVLDVLRQRVLRLPPPAPDLLAAIAVADGPVDVEDAAAAAGVPVDDALGALEAALHVRLLSDAGEGRFALRHALLAEALRAPLSSARTARLHRVFGDRLAARAVHRPRGEDASRIAHHYLAARSTDGGEAALPWLGRAADHAVSVSALPQLRDLQEQLISVLDARPELDPHRRQELRARGRLAYADVWSAGHDSPAVREYTRLVRAWSVPTPAEPDDMELLWLATVFQNQVGRLDEGDRTVDRMAALAADLDDDTATYLWLDMAAAIRWMQARHLEALQLLDRAEELVARGRVDLGRSLCFSPPTRLALVRALALWHLGEPEAAFALSERALREAEAVGLGAAGFARRWALVLALMDGNAARVRTLVALQLPDPSWEGFRYPSAVVAFAAGWLRTREGDLAGGLDGMRAAHAALRDQGVAGGRTVLLGLLAEATLHSGAAAEALALCDAGLTLAERGERYWVPALHRVRAAALGTDVSGWQEPRKREPRG